MSKPKTGVNPLGDIRPIITDIKKRAKQITDTAASIENASNTMHEAKAVLEQKMPTAGVMSITISYASGGPKVVNTKLAVDDPNGAFSKVERKHQINMILQAIIDFKRREISALMEQMDDLGKALTGK